MDCYLIHKKYRNKDNLNKPYQESNLLFVFKNFKFKECPKQQIIMFKITMLFSSNKLVILTNKNRLIKLIKTNHYTCSLSYLTFSEFDTFLNSRLKLENIIKLKNIKINIKEEDLTFILENMIIKKVKVKIDNVNKEIYITGLPNYCYDNLKEGNKGFYISPWKMKNYEKYYTVRSSDIIKIDTI